MGTAERLQFGLLGPLEIRRSNELLRLRGRKQQALLTLLLLEANRVVSSDRLIEDLWAGQAPTTAQTALHVHVSHLRRLLEPGVGRDDTYRVLVTQGSGYVLRLAPAQLDIHRFERVVDEGSAALLAGDADRAASTLRDALSLWRGPALADFLYEPFAHVPAARLEELRLAAVERRIEADLACGRHGDVVPELTELTSEHPLRETLAALLMLALYRSGRQAEALDVYQRTRRMLVDDLGIDPGPALQQLERDILVQDAGLDVVAAPDALPSGTIALTFTDIEDSTGLLERLGDAYSGLLADYRRIVRSVLGAKNGHEVDRQGDGFFFVFKEVRDAIGGAVALQEAVLGHAWPEGQDVRVRIGVHVGAPSLGEGGYVGFDVHRGVRVGAAAHGGQIVLSREAAEAAGLEGFELRDLGEHALKGVSKPEALFQLVVDGLQDSFPPPRVAGIAAAVPSPQGAILVLSDAADRTDSLAALAEQLARGSRPHELVLAKLLAPADAAELPEVAIALGRTRDELAAAGVTARVAAFTSQDRVADVNRLAERTEIDLLLMAAPDNLIRNGVIGEELAALLSSVLCDVAFLVTRVSGRDWLEGPVLAPFGGGQHDWAALELAAWLAAATGRPLHLLGAEGGTTPEQRDASRLLADASLLIQRASGVAPVPRLVGTGRQGIIDAAAAGGLLVIGVSERWTGEGLGVTRWAIARSAPVPVLFVRNGPRPSGLAPATSATKFGWSVTFGR